MADSGDAQLAIADKETNIAASTEVESNVEIQDLERNLTLKKLYKAAMGGDWEAARAIFEGDQETKTVPLIGGGATALHVAAYCGRSEFVEKLVSLLSAEELEIQDISGNTALHSAAYSANVKVAQAMVNKNRNLPQFMDNKSRTPFYYAARCQHPSKNKDMVEYLYSVTDIQLLCTSPSARDLVIVLTASDSYAIALRLLEFNTELAVTLNPLGWSILHVLAAKPSAFASGSTLPLWKRLIYPWMKNVSATRQRHSDSLKLVHFICYELQKRGDLAVVNYFLPPVRSPILHIATEHGVFKLVEVCLRYFPYLMWQQSREGKHLLHAAVEHRRVRIFDHIIHLVGGSTGLFTEVEFGGTNNILHLAARLAPWRQLHSVPGPAFQIQRELQWFKAVGALVYDEQRFTRNSENNTPQELFFKEHEALLNGAKEWMKDTSNSCMVVATLVATVAFAAMITVPGGNDSDTGMPILSKKNLFLAFSISNAVSMVSSAICLLMFLSVQTSRYTEEDFLESLPKILLKGLLSLFVAVVTMMIAFGTALGMAFQTRVKWAYIPITVVACIPTIIFTRLHLPLLFQTFLFTSGPGIFRGQTDPKLWWLKKMSYRFLPNDDHLA